MLEELKEQKGRRRVTQRSGAYSQLAFKLLKASLQPGLGAQTSWLCTGYRSPELVAPPWLLRQLPHHSTCHHQSKDVRTWMLSLLPVSHQRSREALGTVTTLQGRNTARKLPGPTMWMESGVDPEERQGKPGGVVYRQTATLHARVPACREGESLGIS